MSIEAMKQALEALEKCMYPQLKQLNAITSLRQAIEQADKQEPVGEVIDERGNVDYVSYVPSIGTKLYTTPQPQREWVGLTEEEVAEIAVNIYGISHYDDDRFYKDVEAKLKKKNNQ